MARETGRSKPGRTAATPVAAQEARRLNERWRRSTNDHTEKVTKTAVDRVLAGQVHFLHNESP